MTALILGAGSAITMSSREIAELVEARHDNVKRTIETLVTRGVIESPQSEEIPTATKPVQVYKLRKRDSLIVVAQLCPEFTARIVDRWQELEQQASIGFAIPKTMGEALRLAADEHDKRIAAESALAVAAPKAEALDRIATAAEGSLCVTDAAKALQMAPRQLFAWLQAHQWIYRRAGCSAWLGYQDRVQSGLLEHKVTTVSDSTGRDKLAEQVRVTAKGMARLASLVGRAAA